MRKRKRKYISTSPFTYVYEYQVSPRRTVYPGDKIKIKGETGWFKFISITTNPIIDATWVDCRDKNGRWRSFRLERIKAAAPKRRNGVIKHDEQ